MADRIRFHLDEHVDPAVAVALRRVGIDVTTTNEAGLRTKDDETHFNFAKNEGRVIVTRDQDFHRLVSGAADHPGVAFYAATTSLKENHRGIDSYLRSYDSGGKWLDILNTSKVSRRLRGRMREATSAGRPELLREA